MGTPSRRSEEVSSVADIKVIDMIRRAAKKTGADPVALLATALTENGARYGLTPGDHGTSYSAFQWHKGGALGNHPKEWTLTQDAFDERAGQFAKYGVHHGKGAAAVQRPADRAGYEQKVNSHEQEARQLLKLPDGTPAQTQPQFIVPGNVPQTPAQTLLGAAGPTAPNTGAITLRGLLDSSKDRLGQSNPTPQKSKLLEYLMQQASADAPAPLKLPDGTVATTQPNRPATGAPGVDTAAVGRVFDPHTKFKMGGGPAAHQARAIGNWQSDNAVDLMVPVGTPIYAPADGVVGSRIGSLNSKSPLMAGLRASLSIKGNELYFAHMSRLNVKAGQKVKAGQIIGWSGSANGADHLHLGVKNGDPSAYK